jgi:hypothetical protein
VLQRRESDLFPDIVHSGDPNDETLGAGGRICYVVI